MIWWPFSRHPTDPEKTELAEHALQAAETELERTKKRDLEVREVTDQIRRYREENGWSGKFREAMRRA